MRKNLLFTLLLGLFCVANAYSQSYSFTKSFQTYADLSNPISLNKGKAWWDTTFTVPLGFQFEYYGTKYNNIIIDTDGVLYFNTNERETIHVLSTVLSDLERNDTLPSKSPIGYKIDGTAGGRIFKVEFKNSGFFPRNTDFINFQVWLYEGSNNIEMRYGSSNILNLNADFINGGPLIGVRKSTSTNYFANNVYLSGYNMQATAVVNSQSQIYMTGVPTQGTTYLFTYTPGQTPTGITENEAAARIELFPNPAQQSLAVRHQEGEPLTSIRITDLSGRTVATHAPATPEARLDIAALPAGAYLLQVTTAGQHTIMKRFIKQ